MKQYQQVNKQLFKQNTTVDHLLKNIENQEQKAKPEADQKNEKEKEDSRWKKKFIKIWQEGEQRDKEENKNFDGFEAEENEVGPEHFRIGAKLGQGSFGQVYLVEKFNIQPD
jgi:hypothetical protein